MEKTELKELVKRYFKLVEATEETSEESTKQEFADAELIDGTKVTNDKDAAFGEGDSLFVETAEGDKVQAPEGEHELKSGIVVVVDSEGTITGIRRPDEEGEGSLESSEEEMSETSEETTEETFEDEEEKLEDDEEKMEVEEKVIQAIAEMVMPEIEKMKEEMANCMERVEKAEEKMKEYMSETPASESKTSSKFSKTSTSINKNEGPKYQKRRYEMTLAKLNNHKK